MINNTLLTFIFVKMKKNRALLPLILVSLMALFTTVNIFAQTMNMELDDQGPTPSGTEYYFVHLLYVEEHIGGEINELEILSGAYQSFSANTYYPDGTIQVSFTADVPDDVEAKIYRVKFRVVRDNSSPPVTPYIAEGDGYSEFCNSDMFYDVLGFAGFVTLN